jgi:hypothetical protein
VIIVDKDTDAVAVPTTQEGRSSRTGLLRMIRSPRAGCATGSLRAARHQVGRHLVSVPQPMIIVRSDAEP